MKSKFILLFAILMIALSAKSQLTVNNGHTAQDLANILAGENITATNVSITGNSQQYGSFTFTGEGLDVNSGVILSSGSIFDAVGPNNSENTSTDFGGAGNTLLTNLANSDTHDAVVLQFDFEVQSDKIEFNFNFLSEEYNEYVGSPFNDVFAFFISGPGIDGEENLAIIPGTTTPVTINSINNDQFWQFYHDNTNGNTNIEFDGFTTLLTAKKEDLQSCETYTLKLMIADAGDGIFDAGVLLQENSLVQASVSASSSTYSDNNTALEGCIEADFTFQLDDAVDYDVEIPLNIGGSAINGVDFKYIDPLIIIPAGQTSATIIIESYSDGMTEGQETIEIGYIPAPCQASQTVSLFIDDFEPIEFTATENGANCNGSTDGEVLFTISGGFAPYIINLTDTLTNELSSYTANPITGISAGTYSVEIIDSYGCKAEDVVFGDIFNAGTTFLPTGTGVTYETAIQISGFSPGETLETVDQLQQISAVMEHSYANDLSITLRAPNGSEVTLKVEGDGLIGSNSNNSCDMGEPVSSGRVDEWNADNITPGIGYQYVWNADPTYGTMSNQVDNQLLPEHTYISTFGNELTDFYYPPGSYEPEENFNDFIGTELNGEWTIVVTDFYILDNGYIFEWGLSISSPQSDSIITITQPELPVITSSFTNPDCGVDNGEIDITVSGFTPTAYLWNNGETTQDIIDLSSGSYAVNITGNDACDYDYDFNLSNNGSLVLTATSEAETCVGANNGSIDLTVTGGTPDFTYSWDNGEATEDISTLIPGNYTVSVTDAGGCSGVETFEVTEATPIIISADITDENCGDEEGIINISVSGGIENYTFLWSTEETTEDIDELAQGEYSVTITDANSCTTSETFTITNYVGNCIPDCDLAFTYENITDETCGQANGEIDLTIFTSFSPYTVSWDNGATSDDLNLISANNYTISIIDAEGCELSKTYTIENQTSGLEILSVTTIDETCGNGQGEIDITVNGGALPYSFNWSNGATTEDLENISEGDYDLTITDANGCSVNTSVSITNQAGDLALSWGNAINETCGNSQGSIDILIDGGNPFGGGGGSPGYYNYSWSNGATSEDLENIGEGSYSCMVTDEDGCQITTDVYLVENEAGTLAIDDIDVDNEICYNGLGEIELIISGGTTPYNFSWNTGQTSQDIFNLSEGIYNNTITDGNGCSVSTGDLTIINESGTLTLESIITTDELCNNNAGEIDLTIIGGLMPYNYLWNTGSSDEDLNGLNGGNYSCEIIDANGCLVSVNSTINNNNGAIAVSNTVISDENCGNTDGAIDITITGAATPISFSWDNGTNTEDLTNIAAGNYNCIITDAVGCETNAPAIVDNNSGDLQLNNSIVTNEQCGAGNGSVNIIVSGSATPFTFNWTNGETSEDINMLVAGIYSCIITDNNGCSINAGPYNINNTSSTMAVSNVDVTNETCGSGNGAINLTITGGEAPISFTWSNGETTEDLIDVTAGIYSYTITDNSSCSVSGSAEVLNEAGNLTITSFTKTDEICGNGNGAIDITVNGSAPFNFAWSNGSTSEDITGLSAGIYNVTINDDNGCELTSSDYNILNDGGAFTLTNITTIPEHCNDGTGSINADVENGTEPINYLWSNSDVTQDITDLSQGVYSCITTDANGCELNYFATVENIEGNISVSNETLINETCGNSNGSIDIEITGGVEPYSFAWSNGETTEDLSNLEAGTYNCVITDSEGCGTNYSATIEDIGGDFNLIAITPTDENCNNGDGAINLTITGGTLPYVFLWNNGETTEDLTNLSQGTYNVVVTDDIGCEINASTTVDNIDGVLQITNANITDEQCGQANGAIDISIEGAVEPISFIWSNGWITEDVSNLVAGDYTVTITDNTNCSTAETYTVINETNGFSISVASTTNEQCGQTNGAIDINVSGGTLPYTFIWSNGDDTEDLINLTAGTYTGIISDNTGCELSISAEIINETNGFAVNLESITNDECNSGLGAININITGGTQPYTFVWSNGSSSEDLTNIVTGSYIVTVTDNAGCSVTSEQFNVGNNTNPNLGFATINVTNDFCGTGQGWIETTPLFPGTYEYEIDGQPNANGTDFLSLYAGIYVISIIDGNCRVDETVIVDNEAFFNILNVDITNEYCGQENGEINLQLDPPNGYQFNWSNGESTKNISSLSAGTYTCEIFHVQSGCTDYVSAEVLNISTMDVTTTVYNESCGNSNGAIDISVTGGISPYIFNWSNGENTEDLNAIPAGTYTCEITDSDGCITIISETVENETNGLSIIASNIENDMCAEGNGNIDISVVGGTLPYDFLWSNGETTEDISGLIPGSYTVTITDNTGCGFSETYEISDNMGFGSIWTQNDYCNSGQGEVYLEPIIPGTYTYELDGVSNGSSYFQNILAGEHIVTIINATCQVDSVITIENDATFFANVQSVTNDVCEQSIGVIEINVGPMSGNYSYNWSNGETTQDISNLVAGTYICTITDNNSGCTDEITVEVGNTETLQVTSISSEENCGDGTGAIDLTVIETAGDTQFDWSNGETTEDISNLFAGTYTCIITDLAGCSQTITDEVTNNTGALQVASNIQNDLCGEDVGFIELTITGTADYTILWGDGNSDENRYNLSAGTYSVEVTNNTDGCLLSDSYEIETEGTYSVSDVITNSSCETCNDGAIDLTPDPSDNYSYDWDNGAITEDITGLLPGDYTVLVSNDIGCEFETTYTVDYEVSVSTIENMSISVYPNPTNGILKIDYKAIKGNSTIRIGNIIGILLYENIISNNEGSIEIDVSGYSAGIYYLSIGNKEQRKTIKIFKQSK